MINCRLNLFGSLLPSWFISSYTATIYFDGASITNYSVQKNMPISIKDNRITFTCNANVTIFVYGANNVWGYLNNMEIFETISDNGYKGEYNIAVTNRSVLSVNSMVPNNKIVILVQL